MTDRTNSFEDTNSLSSILLKRETAASAAVFPVSDNITRPKSASSTGSFQFVTDEKELNTPLKSNTVLGLRGESISGGGYTGEKDANLMSILVDSKVASSSKKLSVSSTPRGLAYQLYFVTPHMISTNDICGGQIATQKYDAFCAKSGTCKIRSHKDKDSRCKGNTIFIIGKSNTVNGSADKIMHPDQFHLKIKPAHHTIARKLLSTSNAKLFSVRNFEKAGEVFNTFVEEFHGLVSKKEEEDTSLLQEDSDESNSLNIDITIPADVNMDHDEVTLESLFKQVSSHKDAPSSSDSSSAESESGLSFETDRKLARSNRVGNSGLTRKEEEHARKGFTLGTQFESDPIKAIAMLGSIIAKQEDIINEMANDLRKLKAISLVSNEQLEAELDPVISEVQRNTALTLRVKSSVDRLKKKTLSNRLNSGLIRQVTDNIETTFQEKFIGIQDELEVLQNNEVDEDVIDKIDKLEIKVMALEGGGARSGGIFPTPPISNMLIPEVVRGDIAGLEFKIALLESRVGAETLRFGNITLKSLVDAELFVNDEIPSFSYGCFFDLVALLDSLRDTTTTEKSFLESEYNAQKTKFVSINEASTSASFLHVAPLVFCGNSSTTDSKYGSIERSLPHVKTREHWVSLGGMEGMKRQLEEEILSKVGSTLEEIPLTLGDSKGADLAKSFLLASQTCFNKFVNWTETFYQELLGNSQVTEKEAWMLILHCWMAFFADLRQIRMACSNLSPGRHEIGSEGRTKIVARYIWTMGRAIIVQNEYCNKQFRNHPSIATVINYHLFQHRVPMSLYKTNMGKLEGEVKTINAWKAQLGRDMKDLKKIVTDRA